MARFRSIPVYGLNIAANPHLRGAYIELLTRGARAVVKAHGSDYAKITPPRATDQGHIFVGSILLYTELNLRGRWYDTESGGDLPAEIRKLISVPARAKPNYRVFSYIFNETRHRFYYEARNEDGETLGPTTVRRVLTSIMDRAIQGPEAPNVEVTIIPKAGAVDRILGLRGLRRLTMRVVLPNPDTTDPEAVRRVRKRIADANAKSLEQTYIKDPAAEHIVATAEIKETASVAAENGFVTGDGLDNNNKPTSLSTTKEPRREYVDEAKGYDFLSRFLASIPFF